MTSDEVLHRLRLFLLMLSAGLAVGTVVELLFGEHFQTEIQLLPFAFSAAALGVALLALMRPHRSSLLLLRGVMALVALGSLFGIYEHVASILAFLLEIKPATPLVEAFWQALFGANPLLAPGVLGLAAILAMAATWQHPALAK
jgi:hypothetical protein